MLGPELKFAMLEHLGFRLDLSARNPTNVLEKPRPNLSNALGSLDHVARRNIHVLRHFFKYAIV